MRGTRYSRFIHGLQNASIALNRKMLSQLAIEQPQVFDRLVEIAGGESAPAPKKKKTKRAPADKAATAAT